ncbi:MAG: hypothetical protein K1X64_09130 [Myxococcaceae bacterium]|nr:hypothetical protein [Myxococcaceae bacterium]
MKTFFPLLMLLSACGFDSVQAPSPQATTRQNLQAESTLTFNSDWTVRQSSALVMGEQLRIEYNAARIQNCLGNYQDNPAWVATAHYILGDAPERTVQVGGYTSSGFSSVVPLDREGELTLWFEVTNRWGCQWFDSAYGQNYHFNVTDASTVHFNADWSISRPDDLSSAKAIRVEYALERLPTCRAYYRGYAAWDILAYARFDGGPVQSTPVTRGFGAERVAVPAAFTVPAGAKDMEVWFFNSDEFGCHLYDSNWGQNYHLQLR